MIKTLKMLVKILIKSISMAAGLLFVLLLAAGMAFAAMIWT